VPLDETFTEIVECHGRSYQQYALTNGTYFVPIDEVKSNSQGFRLEPTSKKSDQLIQDEIARLEVMHGVLNSLFDNRLIFPPIRSPRRILDLGCGSGDWAVDVAMSYPNAEVR
jgi:tRNA G46 methylase TrmB